MPSTKRIEERRAQALARPLACGKCGNSIPPKRLTRHAKFCCHKCSKDFWAERLSPSFGKGYGIPTGTVGAMSEMRVCVDLFERGFSVFRALSPSCKCDLIAMNTEKLLRIEVKTGYRTAGGKLSYPKANNDMYDIMAVVIRGEGIVYIPEP